MYSIIVLDTITGSVIIAAIILRFFLYDFGPSLYTAGITAEPDANTL